MAVFEFRNRILSPLPKGNNGKRKSFKLIHLPRQLIGLSEDSTKLKNKTLCACGCDKTRLRYDTQGRERRYIYGHQRSKGDNAGYVALHKWVNRYLPKPDMCQICNIKPPKHLANITGKYARDFSNWGYLCILCHARFDYKYAHSLEVRKKISKTLKANPVKYWLNKQRSEETKKKISKANKNKHYSPKTEFKKGNIPWNKK